MNEAMNRRLPVPQCARLVWRLLSCALLLTWSAIVVAQTADSGQWYRASPEWRYQGQRSLVDAGLTKVDSIAPTGGEFWYQSRFNVSEAGIHVVDFRNSSVIGRFDHYVIDRSGRQVARLEGGLQSTQPTDFPLRHGREVSLTAGEYTLITRVDSPFYLAGPLPYVDTLAHYRQAIKPANMLTLLCLGIFIGLGLYYASLGIARRRMTDSMYALFILGNLLYNGTGLLVFKDLFGLNWFYLISFPILLSNIAYLYFVTGLLEIRKASYPRLYQARNLCVGLFVAFIVLALLKPNWSLELDRIGVAIFILFGFACGVNATLQGNPQGQLYLIANVALLIPGITSISIVQVSGSNTMYVEHLGLAAVTVEVILLALVLSHQFGMLYRERKHAQERAEQNLRIACTDALTGLPNRYALETALVSLPQHGSLTFIDLDGLKHYNDHFGHERGNMLLRGFARHLHHKLGPAGVLHRIGGDEFAVTSNYGEIELVEQALNDTVVALQADGFEFSGASFGSVRVTEASHYDQLEHLADSRMYQHKRQRRTGAQGSNDLFVTADRA